jgi:hypothetical protein
MSRRSLIVVALLAMASFLIAEASTLSAQRGQGRGRGQAGAQAPAQKPTPNSRFGRWKNDNNAPPPQSNIMTYEPWGNGGMKVTVATVNAQGEKNQWSYETLFDGVFRPVTGQENAETAVEFIDARSTRIQNKRGGRVTQILINTLSEDGKTINNEYVRFDENGKITGVTHAVYRRIE